MIRCTPETGRRRWALVHTAAANLAWDIAAKNDNSQLAKIISRRRLSVVHTYTCDKLSIEWLASLQGLMYVCGAWIGPTPALMATRRFSRRPACISFNSASYPDSVRSFRYGINRVTHEAATKQPNHQTAKSQSSTIGAIAQKKQAKECYLLCHTSCHTPARSLNFVLERLQFYRMVCA